MVDIITVTAETVDDYGFFCKMSARKSPAWQAKRAWLLNRFAEGLQLRLLGEGERGFIEFMPGAKCWRAIDDAEDYMVIHCLWVVGASKGQGHAGALLDTAETWAREAGFRGIAALTGSGNWLISPGVLEHRGYTCIDRAEHGFQLTAKTFESGTVPHLSGGWHTKAEACEPGLTVLRSAQCPYLEDAAMHASRAADRLGLAFHDRVIETADDLRRLSPSPYGTYALVHDGRLVSYHYLLEKQIVARLS
ncbi:GNAT family N-acetyltransferase [Sinisalibacter aestuarii]|uniref:Acetyltransferase n=1 Tax=Sinisalibacter aestuarii TaxID=2949426 RepID=A0ABQ5LVG8_9RHOB|nr:GNAT family N-acetyltransferase [Sinisalibacter aestuarii]GKY88869.1 acetyltransferase [Sinisalibacter aestuarii]